MRSFDPKPAEGYVKNARAIVMDDANCGTRWTYAAFSGDLLDLLAKNCLLDLPDDPFAIIEAEPEPFWAGDPVRSRYSVKLMGALLPIIRGRFSRSPDLLGCPSQRTHLSAGQCNGDVLSTPFSNCHSLAKDPRLLARRATSANPIASGR